MPHNMLACPCRTPPLVDTWGVRVCAGVALEFDLPGAFGSPGALQLMPKRTYQPNRYKRKKKHGFLKCVGPAQATCRSAPSRPPRMFTHAQLQPAGALDPPLDRHSAHVSDPLCRRNRTPAGRKILARRRARGRWQVAHT